MADHEDTLADYEEDTTEITTTVVPAAAADTVKKGSYVSVHATGFKDFLLHEPLMKALTDAAFEHPSEVQQQTIPQAMMGNDVLCQAKSGMGKTAVFVLSTLQQLGGDDKKDKEGVLCLVLSHTRELAYQIDKEYKRFAKYIPHIRPTVFYGGQPITENRATLTKEKPNIIVGTPGRILALVREKSLVLQNLEIFVLDECDKMLEQADMRSDVQEIFMSTPHNKQVMMFTATLPAEVRTICKKFMHNPLEIFVDNETKLTLHGLQQFYVSLSEGQKIRKLLEILDSLEFNQVVIFVKSAQRTEALASVLRQENFPVVFIHARLPQEERIKRYTNFKAFKDRIMVATDLFGRGIDIAHVNIVINFDMPEDSDSYLHRVGRAGRFGTKGLAITFVQETPEDVEMIEKIQKRFEVEIKELPATIDKSTYMMA